METRRNVLKSSAAVSAFAVGGLSGQMVKCGPTGIVVDPAVIQQVQQAVAAACNWIPAGLTIALVERIQAQKEGLAYAGFRGKPGITSTRGAHRAREWKLLG